MLNTIFSNICVCIYTHIYMTRKDKQIYTLWNNESDFLQVSKNPLGNKEKNKTNQKSPGPGSFSSVLRKHLVPLMCLVDLLSISVLKLVFNQAYAKKMLLPNL